MACKDDQLEKTFAHPFENAFMPLTPKRLLKTLLSTVTVIGILLFGCRNWRAGRIVRIVDTDQNQPAADKTLAFFKHSELAPLVKVPAPLRVQLDANGEARVALPRARAWVSFNENATNFYGTSLKPADITHGGRFQLYGSPPVPGDTNLYPSKYVLEIKRP